MIDLSDRIKYYLGRAELTAGQPAVTSTHGYDIPIKLNFENYKDNYHSVHPNTLYPQDVIRYLHYANNKSMFIQCGDSPYIGDNFPVLVKTRDSHKPPGQQNGVVANLNSARHFGEIGICSDTPWNYKFKEMVWRGADTGWDGSRLNFVKKFGEHHNVGFSHYVQDAFEHEELYQDPSLIRGHMPQAEMLRYKYLPVLDGNDKSSSLGWVMASGSVPLMPKPRYHSWVCEPWMLPGVHYVEVERDWSNLGERLEWCRNNDDKCKEIADNGEAFMIQFTDKRREMHIESRLAQFCAT